MSLGWFIVIQSVPNRLGNCLIILEMRIRKTSNFSVLFPRLELTSNYFKVPLCVLFPTSHSVCSFLLISGFVDGFITYIIPLSILIFISNYTEVPFELRQEYILKILGDVSSHFNHFLP